MSSLNISVPQSLRKFIDQRTKETSHSTPTEYIRSLIREDQKRARAQRGQLVKLLDEGLESGEPIPVTPEYLTGLRRRMQSKIDERRHNHRKRPR